MLQRWNRPTPDGGRAGNTHCHLHLLVDGVLNSVSSPNITACQLQEEKGRESLPCLPPSLTGLCLLH